MTLCADSVRDRPERASTLFIGAGYRITRHPMQVGKLFVLPGWAVFLSTPLAWPGPLRRWL